MIRDEKFVNAISLLEIVNKDYKWIMRLDNEYVISKNGNKIPDGVLEHFLFIDESTLNIDLSFLNNHVYYLIEDVISTLNEKYTSKDYVLIYACCNIIGNLLATNKIEGFNLELYNFEEYIEYLKSKYKEDFYEISNDLTILGKEASDYLKYLVEKETKEFDEERLYKLNEMKEGNLINE